MTDKCYICGMSRGSKTRKYTCAEPACENNWAGYRQAVKALDNEVAYQLRQHGERNPWVQWAKAHQDETLAGLRLRWHVHKDAPERA